METGELPDVRTAEDTVAAHEVWDYIEQHEAAGTLPLCIVPLRTPVLEMHRELVEETAMQQGIDPKRIVDAWIRPVRSMAEAECDQDGPGFVIDIEYSDPTQDV